MAIAYVGSLPANSGANPYNWFGNGPISLDPRTPGVGNTILIGWSDLSGTGKTASLTSTSGIYTQLATLNGLSGETDVGFSSVGVSGATQTITADSSPTGDYLNLYGWEWSGVGSVSLTSSTATSASTTVGAIAGTAITVPTGSSLFAVCFETSHTLGTPPVIDTGTATYTNYYNTLGVTYAGAGSPITPLFTPGGATATSYTIFHFLLNPPGAGSGSNGAQMLRGIGARLAPGLLLPVSSLGWIIHRRALLARNRTRR